MSGNVSSVAKTPKTNKSVNSVRLNEKFVEIHCSIICLIYCIFLLKYIHIFVPNNYFYHLERIIGSSERLSLLGCRMFDTLTLHQTSSFVSSLEKYSIISQIFLFAD